MSATDKRQSLRGKSDTDIADAFPDPPEDAAETPADEPEPEEELPPLTVEADGSVLIRLTKPLRPYDGKGQDALKDMVDIRIRQMYAGDMIVLDGADGTIAQVMALAKRLSGQPSIALQRMHSDDYARVHGVVQARLGKFLGISQALSALSLG